MTPKARKQGETCSVWSNDVRSNDNMVRRPTRSSIATVSTMLSKKNPRCHIRVHLLYRIELNGSLIFTCKDLFLLLQFS